MNKEALTFNKRLELAGVITHRVTETDYKGREIKAIYLEYNGKKIGRPPVNKIEKWCLENFGINI